MALSVVARAKIRQALQQGAAIPSTWATDKEGQPTTDPKAALSGFLMAIGGHTGYGLALVVDLLAGLLSGASYLTRIQSWGDNPEPPQHLGPFFLLIDTARLGAAGWLKERTEDFRSILHDPSAPAPAPPVMRPGALA